MSKPPVHPRVRLAKNLQALMDMQQISSPVLAARAKVDRKTINNLLRGRFDPRLTVVEKIANAFGFTTWQLLAADLETRKIDSVQVIRLLDRYSSATEDGRAAIMQVAQIAQGTTVK